MIAVVDYHKGNLKSVERGLIAAGAEAFVTDDAGAIARADAIVLPGVGAFADAATTMRDLGRISCLRKGLRVPLKKMMKRPPTTLPVLAFSPGSSQKCRRSIKAALLTRCRT